MIAPHHGFPRAVPLRGLVFFLPLLFLGACAPAPETETGPKVDPGSSWGMNEKPVPEGPWREHRLAGCREDTDVPGEVEKYLGICSEFFRDGSGSDGMIEMEYGLAAGHRHSLMLLTLGQLYLIAGQGRPELLPVEGPAADTGDWERNKVRLLGRARKLLTEARDKRPDDAAVEFLLADVERAAGNRAAAEEHQLSGTEKCTGGRSYRILRQYQQLNRYPAKYLGGPPLTYPDAAARKGISGDVVCDLLIDPAGRVRQVVVVESPAGSLSQAAEKSLRGGEFEVARVGKYPVWSWLRVTTTFNLSK
jgi:TonB family protein